MFIKCILVLCVGIHICTHIYTYKYTQSLKILGSEISKESTRRKKVSIRQVLPGIQKHTLYGKEQLKGFSSTIIIFFLRI